MSVTKYLTTRQVSEILAVDIGKVTDWIAVGDLHAVNVAKVRGVRARWRIPKESLEAFIASRGNRTTEAPAPRARRQRDEQVTQYFK
jgi:excisionase family DNA binding protein